MLVVSVEQLLGIDCDDAAQAYHLARVKVGGCAFWGRLGGGWGGGHALAPSIPG